MIHEVKFEKKNANHHKMVFQTQGIIDKRRVAMQPVIAQFVLAQKPKANEQ